MSRSLPSSLFRAVLLASLFFAVEASLLAGNVKVRFAEGLTRGFLTVSDASGKHIGDGDLDQLVKGNRVSDHFVLRFKDGSRYDDTAVFTQDGVFHLLTDHLIEHGSAFKGAMETDIDTVKGQVTVRYKDAHGNDKTRSKQMELPSDLANGILYILVKDMNPNAGPTTVSYLAATPEPRLVKLIFTREGKDAFATGTVRRDAEHYVVHVDIGGLTGAVARLIGKQPPNTDMWVIGGEAPTFAGSSGPLDGNGGFWKISLVSPALAELSATPPH